MKCPKCGGTGEMQICEMGFIGKDECDKCHGKGYLNNEEWFCSLSTEEKAKEIYKIAKDDFKELRKLFYGVANDDCDAVALWLKQPQKENE